MKLSVSILLILISLSACAQKDTSILRNWKSQPVPNNRDTINRYGFSLVDWKVFMVGDTVKVSKRWPAAATALPFKIRLRKEDKYLLSSQPLLLQVDDGYLAGYNHGEFGGGLYWFSNDGKTYYKVAYGNMHQFLKRDNHIYMLEGLAHLGISSGSIMSIEK